MKKLLIATMFTSLVATSAQAMDVGSFLARGEALRALGAAAMLSPDYRTLQAELRASATEVRRERLLAVRAGRRPAYCPPTGASLSQEEIQRALLHVPASLRPQTEVRDAIRAAFVSKYPCGG